MNARTWCSPGQLVLLMLAGWINREQPRFTDAQRRRLALEAKVLSRRALAALGPLVTPDTLCRWLRKHAGAKYDSSAIRRPGRPAKPQIIRDLVVRLSK